MPVNFYLAPMEGLTGFVVRNAFFHNFNCFDKYFTPFIPCTRRMHKKYLRDIDPGNNEGIVLVPQIMTNRPEEAVDMARQLAAFGYEEINLNLGCPSGTVTSKGRGSGFLADPEALDHFLGEVYSHTDIHMTVKTRVGFKSDESWEELASVYRKYPQMGELIIHPRIQKDMYRGPVRMDAFDLASRVFSDRPGLLCYNGDIFTAEDYHKVHEAYPAVDKFMVGRGAFFFPDLVCRIQSGGSLPWPRSEYRERLFGFHDEIFSGYSLLFGSPKEAVSHMKEIWFYLRESFADSPGLDMDREWKRLRKCRNEEEYLLIVEDLRKRIR